MFFLDLVSDIVMYIFPDLVSDKQISHKTRNMILVIFFIVSLCHIGISAYCIFRGIKKEEIILIILGISCIILFLSKIIKAIKNYKESQQMNKEIIKDFFDNLAPHWDNEPIADREIIDAILDNGGVTENIDVLDIACGTGVLFPYYLERNVKSITAVDLSPEMVKIAKSKFPQANVICGDAENITFDSQFDVIMIYNAFPHFPNPKALIENLSKALKTNGRISIAHGMSKKELDEIHMKSAGTVSKILPECEELKELLEPYFNVDIMISNDKMYQVTGTKK